jgi:NAD(P)-dependent dehydrogenase (short-subunit alcohol dehydrogenase family)
MDTSTWLLTGASSGLGYALADYVLNPGTQFGTLGTCGTGSVRYVTEQQGTASALSGRFIDQAASTSTPIKIHSVDRLTVNTVTGEATYTGTYRCT